MVDLSFIQDNFLELVRVYGMKILIALTILIIGWISINVFIKIFTKKVSKSKKVEPSLESFIISLTSVTLKILLIVTVISMVGVEVTSFIAILGAVGFAVGLALQGSLGNFAGGILILTLKPFKIGDFIETQGHMGVVNSITVFNTILKTVDNKTVIIPNGAVSNGNIVNFTSEKLRRVDFVFGISYKDNIDKARKIIEDLIKKEKRIIKNDKDKKPQIVVSNLGDSSVDITVRVWTKLEDFWDVRFGMLENVKKDFDKKGISIPFPQTDVHVFNEKK